MQGTRRLISITAATVVAVTAGAAADAGPALAAAPHAGARHFTEVEAGVQLSSAGNRFEDTFKIKSGPFGAGSGIRDATLSGDHFPVSGHDTAVSYYRGGRSFANETLTFATPLFDGVGAVSGTGTCQGGSGPFANQSCTYRITGTYDLLTQRMFLTLRGTYTSAAKTKT